MINRWLEGVSLLEDLDRKKEMQQLTHQDIVFYYDGAVEVFYTALSHHRYRFAISYDGNYCCIVARNSEEVVNAYRITELQKTLPAIRRFVERVTEYRANTAQSTVHALPDHYEFVYPNIVNAELRWCKNWQDADAATSGSFAVLKHCAYTKRASIKIGKFLRNVYVNIRTKYMYILDGGLQGPFMANDEAQFAYINDVCKLAIQEDYKEFMQDKTTKILPAEALAKIQSRETIDASTKFKERSPMEFVSEPDKEVGYVGILRPSGRFNDRDFLYDILKNAELE